MSTAALFEAIRTGNSAAVTALLDSDASLASAKNDSGVSAVLMSVYSGRREIRDLLLSRGAALQLHEAIAVGHLDRVKQFVQNEPSAARSFSPDGFPVVALAAVFGHLEVARYLAAQGAASMLPPPTVPATTRSPGPWPVATPKSSNGCSKREPTQTTVTVQATRHS
ncbi:MAG: ankyrin repeat domain-containing protein [Candidatus Acidiferrum sp.]